MGEAVGEGLRSVVSSVVSGPLEGMGVSVVCRSGGSYGPLSAADIVTATTTAISVTSGASAITSGTRTNGRTHSSKKYHNRPA